MLRDMQAHSAGFGAWQLLVFSNARVPYECEASCGAILSS